MAEPIQENDGQLLIVTGLHPLAKGAMACNHRCALAASLRQ